MQTKKYMCASVMCGARCGVGCGAGLCVSMKMVRMQIERRRRLQLRRLLRKKWLANTTKWPPLEATTWHAWAALRSGQEVGKRQEAAGSRQRQQAEGSGSVWQILPQIFQAKAHKSLIRRNPCESSEHCRPGQGVGSVHEIHWTNRPTAVDF